MDALPRLFHACTPQPSAPRGIEPSLGLDSLPPLAPQAPPPLGRRAIEQALEEGGRRVYGPMRETELLETRPR